MRHLKRCDRIFDRRRGAVVLPVGIKLRHQIGDIAVNKEFALIGPEDGCDMHAAVAARNDHRSRVLSVFGQPAVPAAVFGINGGLPAVIPVDQICRKGAGVLHADIFRYVPRDTWDFHEIRGLFRPTVNLLGTLFCQKRPYGDSDPFPDSPFRDIC